MLQTAAIEIRYRFQNAGNLKSLILHQQCT